MACVKNSTHSVGNLASRQVLTVPEIIAGENIENYTLVEIAFNSDGDREAVILTDNTKEAFLACAVEVMYDGEQFKEFYIGDGEYFRVVHLVTGLRFDTSSYVQIEGTAPAKGQFASWDSTAKKFQLSATKSATALINFEVVDVNTAEYSLGLATVRLEVLPRLDVVGAGA